MGGLCGSAAVQSGCTDTSTACYGSAHFCHFSFVRARCKQTCGVCPRKSSAVLKKLGENCGQCFCPPTFTAGTCEAGLECVHNPRLPDLPGKCVDAEASVFAKEVEMEAEMEAEM